MPPIKDNTDSADISKNAERIKNSLRVDGSGTDTDPLIITDPDQLQKLGNYDTEGVVFEISGDFDLSASTRSIASSREGGDIGSSNWIPIGTERYPFKGTMRGAGDGITVSGMIINEDGNSAYGFFGYVDGATIQGITIKGCIAAPNSDLVGLLAGSVKGGALISSCISGEADSSSEQSVVTAAEAGGLVGKMEGSGTIENSKNYATVTATGSDGNFKAGGIAQVSYEPAEGAYPLQIISCENHGAINGGNHSGGIVGLATGTKVSDCDNYGKVSASYYFGGIMGSLRVGSAVENSSNHGDIVIVNTKDTFQGVGGVVGIIESSDVPFVGSISGVENTKPITKASDLTGPFARIGGIVGSVNNNASVEGANYGNVNFPGADCIGGIVGSASGLGSGRTTVDGENSGKITGSIEVGGIVGLASGSVTVGGTNSGSVSIVDGEEYVYAGGVVGRMTGAGAEIFEAVNNADIDIKLAEGVSDAYYVGGVAGYFTSSEGSIENASNTGNVTAPEVTYVGGIAGRVNNTGDSPENVIIKNCSVSDAEISGKSQVAGLIGNLTGANVENTAASESSVSNSTIKAPAYAGGAFGMMQKSGNISGISIDNVIVSLIDGISTAKNRYSGGFVGCVNSSSDYDFISCSVKDSKFSISEITEVTEVNHIGGFVGSAQNGRFEKCAVASFIFEGDDFGSMTGGFVGYVYDEVKEFKECYTSEIITDINGFVGRYESGVTKDKFPGSYSGAQSSGIPEA